jgi:hypothetical protein
MKKEIEIRNFSFIYFFGFWELKRLNYMESVALEGVSEGINYLLDSSI